MCFVLLYGFLQWTAQSPSPHPTGSVSTMTTPQNSALPRLPNEAFDQIDELASCVENEPQSTYRRALPAGASLRGNWRLLPFVLICWRLHRLAIPLLPCSSLQHLDVKARHLLSQTRCHLLAASLLRLGPALESLTMAAIESARLSVCFFPRSNDSSSAGTPCTVLTLPTLLLLS